ncbi:monosaccharide transporter [Apiospora marii]|uniref:Monosaccharide transporter n=1 Tax=Apiospora marii TaxID=335849 RepID=A0ABR1SHJ5_9PEZI
MTKARSSLPITRRVIWMGITYSLGGFLYGYDTGQISGFLEMASFKQAFGTWDVEMGKYLFSSTRSGLIVGLLSIGNLFGALMAGPLADRLGRKLPIILACFIYCVGAIVQITSQYAWYQVALGRWTGGLGVGALSTLVPLASSETSPTNIRGLVVSSAKNYESGYQMSVTLGILTASLVNLGTESLPSSAAWRITMGLDFVWVSMLLLGLVFVPESPKYLFVTGKREDTTAIIASLMGVQDDHPVLVQELGEMEASLQAERSGISVDWKQILRDRQIRSRILLATGILSFQQLTGVNFFFYYGTSVFAGTGISNSYITQVILSLVNVLCTVPGLYFAQQLRRKRCLFLGALWMALFLVVYASTGRFWLDQGFPQRTPAASGVLIGSTALFIAGFASTWGPISWGEAAIVCPAQCRATSASFATAVYWMWSFLIAFFTPAITARISYAYGYVFGGCCLLMALMVHVCLVESQGRTMEEVDAMYSSS